MNLDFLTDKTSTPEIVALEEKVKWGTSGTLYRLHDVAHDLALLPDPTYQSLYADGSLKAVFIQAKKTVGMGTFSCSARYQCLLAVNPGDTRRGLGKRILGESKNFALKDIGKRGIVYAYIEDGNERSKKIFNALGYRRIGGYASHAFSRTFPKDNENVFTADKDERIIISGLLKKLYADHILTEFDKSVHESDYYIYKDGTGIIAGLQVVPQHWTLLELPGVSGKFFVNLMPRIPGLRMLLDPPGFRCLRISNVYIRDGRESEFFSLVSAVLAQNKLHNAVVQWDQSSPVAKRIAAAGSYGFFGSMSVTSASVMAVFKNFSDNEIEEICKRPVSISPLDP